MQYLAVRIHLQCRGSIKPFSLKEAYSLVSLLQPTSKFIKKEKVKLLEGMTFHFLLLFVDKKRDCF